MSKLTPGQHVIVTGTPGAELRSAIPILRKAGYRFLHDDQIYAKDRKEYNFFVETGRNQELLNVFKGSPFSLVSGTTQYPMQFFDYYSSATVLKLGDFVDKFSRFHPIAFVDVLIAPYLDLFRPFANNVVFIKADVEADLQAIRAWCNLVPSDIEVKIRDIALNRADERLKLFEAVLELDVQDISKLEEIYLPVDL